MSELGIGGEPEIRIVPLHNLYAADPDMIDRIGIGLPSGHRRELVPLSESGGASVSCRHGLAAGLMIAP